MGLSGKLIRRTGEEVALISFIAVSSFSQRLHGGAMLMGILVLDWLIRRINSSPVHVFVDKSVSDDDNYQL